jgi:hypothetical protein
MAQNNDVSKSLQKFRNLEYSFMMDNGYLLFDMTPKKAENKIDCDMVIRVINSSLRTNLSSQFSELSPLNMEQERDLPISYHIIVGLATTDTSFRFIPGYHHIYNRESKDDTETPILPDLYEMIMRKEQIVYFHPYVFHNLYNNNNININNVAWYGVKNTLIDLWGSWDVFKAEGDFMIIDDIKTHDLFLTNPELYSEFIRMEHRGNGEFIKMNADNIVFRIRPIYDPSAFIQLGRPSIYESVIEIVYYFDTNKRIRHTNYTDIDRFEVRTGGALARSCNSKFAQKLYTICCHDSVFKFNLPKIIEYFSTMDYDKLIRGWYPRDMTDNKAHDDPNVLIIDMKLNIKKVYSINVYKFDGLDMKNILRMRMIQSWMNELGLRGGFVVSDERGSKIENHRLGYMIVAGEEVVMTHHNRSGDLAVFQNRFKCIHWKKVRHYHYSNHDHISRLLYENFPEETFVFTHTYVQNNPECHEIVSVINNI